jgi:phage tail protein X
MPVSPFSRYRQLPHLEIVHPQRGATRSLPIRRTYAPSPQATGRQHTFTGYDTVDLLALKYFGREELYWYLLDANQGQLPAAFEIGQPMTIPPLSLATRIERPGR